MTIHQTIINCFAKPVTNSRKNHAAYCCFSLIRGENEIYSRTFAQKIVFLHCSGQREAVH